ncbi:response regulator [bacterium]|nr:MAG: response regulator [bacterium]
MALLQKIMMVEDDPDIQAVASLALEAVGGFEVLVCSGGTEALERVDGFAPDLVVLDVMMPGMDGPTVLKHLRERPQTANLPVVFMTAKAQSHEIAMYKEMGALSVVTKPFDPMTLPQTLLDIWNSNGPARSGTGDS